MTSPSRRADAAANRARIIEAARPLVIGSLDFKLNEVAKTAGVGQGTLYRHFPTRDDLLAAVYRADVDALVAAAPVLLTEHPPLDALRRWFLELAAYARVKRGVLAAVTAKAGSDIAGPSKARIGDAITTLLDAGKADGAIRPDADARDVMLLIGNLTQLDDSEWDDRAPRLLDIVLDGLTVR